MNSVKTLNEVLVNTGFKKFDYYLHNSKNRKPKPKNGAKHNFFLIEIANFYNFNTEKFTKLDVPTALAYLKLPIADIRSSAKGPFIYDSNYHLVFFAHYLYNFEYKKYKELFSNNKEALAVVNSFPTYTNWKGLSTVDSLVKEGFGEGHVDTIERKIVLQKSRDYNVTPTKKLFTLAQKEHKGTSNLLLLSRKVKIDKFADYKKQA